MNEKPRDMLVSMRGSVALFFVVAWNAPLVYPLVSPGILLSSPLFWRILVVQAGWLVLACLLIATSPALHRLVFRRGIPEDYFRRRLLFGAGAYGLLGVVVLGIAMFES